MPVPPIRELEAICGGEGRDPGAARDFRNAYAAVIRKLSIRITWLLLHTRMSANTVTDHRNPDRRRGRPDARLEPSSGCCVGGLVLLQLSFVVDFSDGEIARYRAQVQGTPTNAGGAYLDWLGHYYVPAIAIGASRGARTPRAVTTPGCCWPR